MAHAWNPFVTHVINVPGSVNMMWNTFVPLPAALAAPITTLFGPAVAYNLVATCAIALSGWTAYLAFRRWIPDRRAAFVGGAAWAFGPFLVSQAAGHLQMTVVLLVPLVLLAIDEILYGRRWSARASGIALGVMLAAQLLIGEEVLAALGLSAAIGVAMCVLGAPKRTAAAAGRALRAGAWAAATFAVLGGYPLSVQLFGPDRVSGAIQPLNTYVSDALAFWTPTRFVQLAPASATRLADRFTGAFAEHGSYLGVPLIAVMAWTVWRHRSRRVVLLAGAMVVAMAVLSLGPALHVGGVVTQRALPWSVLQRAPFLVNLLPSRLMLVTDLFAAMLLAVFVDGVLGSRRWRRATGLAVVAVTVASLFPRTPYPSVQYSVPPFFTGDTIPRNANVVVLPESSFVSADAMAWQGAARMRFRMVGGYFIGPTANTTVSNVAATMTFGHRPVGVTPLQFRRELDRMRIRAIIVEPGYDTPIVREWFEEVFGRSPASIGGMDVWWT
jgi:hypothetical protein